MPLQRGAIPQFSEDEMSLLITRRNFLKSSLFTIVAGSAAPGLAWTETEKPKDIRSYNTPTKHTRYREFNIDVTIFEHEIIPGVRVHMLAFNKQIPGPEIRVKEGEWVRVYFKNDTPLNHTIHWHGLEVPYEMDGVPFVTQPPVKPGETFVYEFRAIPYGTHFYHCHFGTVLHMQSGMHGAFIIERDDDPIKKAYGYSKDYTLMLNAYDVNYVREGLKEMLTRMKERMLLAKMGKLDDLTLAHFKSYEAFLKAYEEGYIPPYMTSRTQPPQTPNFNYFTINGKAYPATEPIRIKKGETIRIRLINTGSLEHYMHMHGHDFHVVCEDGAPLSHPRKTNTVKVGAGKTVDIILEGTNPGYWAFHDHDTRRVTNNGLYPGGMLTLIAYENVKGYQPSVALDE